MISNSLRTRKRLKKKFFMDSQGFNEIKEDSKAVLDPNKRQKKRFLLGSAG